MTNTLQITRGGNGFKLDWWEEDDTGDISHMEVLQDDEDDEMKSGEELLWRIMNYFDLGGSKFDKKRLNINRVRGEKYEPPSKSNEKA